MTTSIVTLQKAWAAHPRYWRRALGGQGALEGFHYQLAISLKVFFQNVLSGDTAGTLVAFEALSDISVTHGSLTYLTQVKTSLDRRSQIDAINEALAVDEFLEECFPASRKHVYFQVTTRRIRGNAASHPGLLTGLELGLKSEQWERWEVVRQRCQSVVVAPAPETELAILLWQHARRPFVLIDACVGRLLDLIPSGSSPEQITKELLKLWEEFRVDVRPPLHLLAAADFQVHADPGQARIIHGVRPSPVDLRDGCFMERPDRLAAALAAVHEAWADAAATRSGTVPVIWVTGPSGSGKSVLLLQMAQELVGSGEIEAVNFIATYANALPRALEYAAGTAIPLIVLGDDLFSPDDNRDPGIWREVGELAATQRWLGESEQSDRWFPCLIAALMPRNRRDHVETITAQPQSCIQGESGLGCDQG